jgi:hypothetical protein
MNKSRHQRKIGIGEKGKGRSRRCTNNWGEKEDALQVHPISNFCKQLQPLVCALNNVYTSPC